MRIFRGLGVALALCLALPSAALAFTPGQIFVKPMRTIVGGSFVHGDRINAFVSPNLAWLGVDCQNTVAMKGKVPAYAERIFGRKQIKLAPCVQNPITGIWYDSKQYSRLPLPGSAIRHAYRHRRQRTLRHVCARARYTVRVGEPRGQHGYVPCSRLRSGRLHTWGNMSLRYRCRAGHPHAARSVRLQVRRTYSNGSSTLLILRFTRRNCNKNAVERQVINGIWSRKRPKR